MGKPACSEEEFIRLLSIYKSTSKVAQHLGIDDRAVRRRKSAIQQKRSKSIINNELLDHTGKFSLDVENGVIIVFSDAHYYPDIISTAHRGLIKLIGLLKPQSVICNGDAFDGAQISRHPRIGWDNKPSVTQELKAVTDRLTEIENAAPKGCRFLWPLGNHDARFETYLAANAPQYQHVSGFSLKDHFPRWYPCWSVWVNDDVVIKHRYKGGMHATHNNTVTSGMSIVTGHTHSLKVTPWTDYRGTRFGVDTGTLADPNGPQFSDYLELNPTNWRSGFAILTFRNKQMLMPELVQVWDETHVQFRGELIEV